MKIVISDNITHTEVSLVTGDKDQDMAVRFATPAEATEFATLWGEWVGATDIEDTRDQTPAAFTAAA